MKLFFRFFERINFILINFLGGPFCRSISTKIILYGYIILNIATCPRRKIVFKSSSTSFEYEKISYLRAICYHRPRLRLEKMCSLLLK